MKRLILDHFRRWWWILALGAVLAFLLGWCMAAPADYGARTHGEVFRFVFLQLKVQSMMLEFSTLTLALLTGVFLLLFDLRRGVIRAVAPLPLTARQIGRSWWLATVAIPASAMVALLVSGAGTFYYSHPNAVFPKERLVIASLFSLVYPGITFTGILTPRPGFSRTGRERAWAACFSLLSSALMLGGLWFFQQEAKHPFIFALYVAVGTWLTTFGWFRAGRFDPHKAGQPNLAGAGRSNAGRSGVRLTPLQLRPRAPEGDGGIPFLLRTTFVRTFWFGVPMIVMLALFIAWKGRAQAIEFVAVIGIFFPFWIIIFQLLPVLQHLRFLRTLPISATRLAVVMLAIAILPLIALGALVAGVAGLALGSPTSLTLLKGCLLNLAPAVLCVFFAAWRGAGTQANALVLLTMIGFQLVWVQVSFHHPEIPFGLAGAVVALCVLVVFLLTRRTLMHSSHAYRVQVNPFSDLQWGMGR